MSTTDTGWADLEIWLRYPSADWFLNDAVLGCLTTDTVHEVLDDYGIAFTFENQKRLKRAIDSALHED